MREKAIIVRVRYEQGPEGWFFATSRDLKGLLVTEPTIAALEAAIPQAVTDLHAARGIAASVTRVPQGGSPKWHVRIQAPC